jgi:hypothetical protein
VQRVLLRVLLLVRDIISELGLGMILLVFGQRQTVVPQTSQVPSHQQGIQQQSSAAVKSISHGVKETTRITQGYNEKQGAIR